MTQLLSEPMTLMRLRYERRSYQLRHERNMDEAEQFERGIEVINAIEESSYLHRVQQFILDTATRAQPQV